MKNALYTSKTVQDRRIVSILKSNRKSYVLYRMAVSDDLGWPLTPQTTSIFAFLVAFTWHVLNFGCPIHISGMAEARALKLCTKGDYIKSGQMDDKSPLKGAWFCSRDPFFCMHSCGVRTKSPLHSVICDQPCPGRQLYWVSYLRQSTLVLHTLRLKLHRFDFSPCLLQTCLYNI